MVITILLCVIVALIVGIVSSERDKPRQFQIEREQGYDEAVADMLKRHCYWDRKESRYITVRVESEE